MESRLEAVKSGDYSPFSINNIDTPTMMETRSTVVSEDSHMQYHGFLTRRRITFGGPTRKF